jgi:hypothetical protein
MFSSCEKGMYIASVYNILSRDQKKKPGKLPAEQTAQEDSEGSEYLPSESELEDVRGLWLYFITNCVLFLSRRQ